MSFSLLGESNKGGKLIFVGVYRVQYHIVRLGTRPGARQMRSCRCNERQLCNKRECQTRHAL